MSQDETVRVVRKLSSPRLAGPTGNDLRASFDPQVRRNARRRQRRAGGPVRYYHVVGSGWAQGDALRCWDDLVRDGLVTDAEWHWEAPIGWDGDVVSLFVSFHEAESHRRQFRPSDRIVEILIPDGAVIQSNNEGNYAIRGSIPAGWVRLANVSRRANPAG